MRTLAATIAGFTFLFAQEAAAQDAAVRVLASNGVKAVIQDIQAQCERAIGHPLALQFNSTASLKQRIDAGETFDAAILTSEAIDALVKERKIAGGTRAEVARCGIGVGIRAGAPKPDIGTPEALKQTLRNAKSIAYAQDGASRVYIEKMFARLGIAADVKPKTILLQGSGPATASVAAGQAELVMTLVSEILPARGIELLGPLPAQLQNYVNFAAGASQANNKTAQALIAFLKGPTAAPAFKARGLEPR